MADPLTPLLSKSEDVSEPESQNHDDDHKLITSLDEVIEPSIGSFGWEQFVQAILVSLASLFDAQQSFISIYTDVKPNWHCSTDNYASTCNSSSNICQLPKSAWAWDGISSQTIISEWGLECSSALIRGLPAASHFMGCLLGVFLLSTLADSSLGRKNLLFLSCLTMSITTFLISLSNHVWVYSILRFVNGFGRSTIGSITIVLLTEKVGKKWRSVAGVMDFIFFSVGMLSLPAIAYINKASSWRNLYLWTCIPTLVYCAILKLFVSESPRWLLMQGRDEEAMATLENLSPMKDTKLIMRSNQLKNLYLVRDESSKLNIFSPIQDLLQRGWAVKRTLALMVLGFVMAIAYYGMTLGIGDLGFNIYLGLAFDGLLEIPSYILTYFLIEKCNRRSSMLIFSTVTGMCNLMIIVVGNEHKGIKIGLGLASFFVACTAYNVLLIYALELFPTCVRSSGTSMVRQAVNFGSAISSLLAAAGSGNEFLLYGVSGVLIICCGFLVICLPETRNAAICDTMDEQERKDNMVV